MTTIKLKNGSGAPATSDLVQGEPALDLTNKRLYTENASGAIIEIGTSPSTIDINAGTIDGTVIGGASAAAGTFTTFTSTGIDDNATSTAITIDSSQRVGINTATFDNAAQVLVVKGDASISTSDADNSGFNFTAVPDTTTGKVGIGFKTYNETASAVAALYATPVGQYRNSLTARYNADSSGGYFNIEQLVPESAIVQERMRIDAAGNVGIGTTNPKAPLMVVGTPSYDRLVANFGDVLVAASGYQRGVINVSGRVAGSDGDADISFVARTAANNNWRTGRMGLSQDGAMTFNTGGVAATDGTERMRIDSSGNVGIGTSSPDGPLSIQINSNSLLTSHGGGRYREFLKAGSGLDTTLRADLSFTSQSSEWDQHIVELYISGGDAVASTQRVGVIKYAVSTLTTMSTPTVLSQDLQGYTLTSSVASGLTLQVTVTATAAIDKFVVVAKVYSQESNGTASSLDVV